MFPSCNGFEEKNSWNQKYACMTRYDYNYSAVSKVIYVICMNLSNQFTISCTFIYSALSKWNIHWCI